MQNIENKVIEILKRYTMDKKIWEKRMENPRIIEDLNISSARIVDIILDIEEAYGIEIDDKTLDKIKTMKDVVNVISEATLK
ncbi:MAG: hypothetical protein PHT69_10195 [Bacteroidales bacterium]|nr:hypothetical protein [Bacteroidales bacterium]